MLAITKTSSFGTYAVITFVRVTCLKYYDEYTWMR